MITSCGNNVPRSNFGRIIDETIDPPESIQDCLAYLLRSIRISQIRDENIASIAIRIEFVPRRFCKIGLKPMD